jgi:hypothetical protein
MVRKALIRSILQIVLLVSAAVALGTTSVSANEEWCQQQAGACAQQCGDTVTWGQVGYYADSCCYWDPVTGCEPDLFCPQYGATWGSGVENFECDEYSQSSYCQCRYR